MKTVTGIVVATVTVEMSVNVEAAVTIAGLPGIADAPVCKC